MSDDSTPIFSVQGPRIKVRRPRTLVAAMTISQEAFIEIDSTQMSQEFLLKLMFHIGQGGIRVRVAEVDRERI
jgi:hypothetical protein